MKLNMSLISLVVFLVVLPSVLGGAAHAAPAGKAQGISHPFICTDNGKGRIAIFSAEGKIEWTYPAPGCQDVWMLPNGNILFSYYRRLRAKGRQWEGGAIEVTRDKKVVWQYKVQGEVHNCQRLPNGNTLLGDNATCELLEVSPAGEVVKRIKTQCKPGHAAMRIARKLSNGNYLVCHVKDRIIREYDPNGKTVREMRAGQCFCAIRLPNGNTLVGGGSAKTVTELDSDGKVVWQITNDDFPEIKFNWIAGVQRLPNGNTVVCNWLGHGKVGQGTAIFEVTSDKKVVWTFTDHKHLRTVSNIQLLDVPGDVTKGEILR